MSALTRTINLETGDSEVRIADREQAVRSTKLGSPERVLIYLNDECTPLGGDARPVIAQFFTINEDRSSASCDYWVTDVGDFEYRDKGWVFIPEKEE